MKKYSLIVLMAGLLGCSVKTVLLANKLTEVPANNAIFKNKAHFEPAVFKDIDTNALYMEQYRYVSEKGSFAKSGDEYQNNRNARFYKFYGNGNVNFFSMPTTDFFNNFSPDDVNPQITGDRGIVYYDDGSIRIDLFTVVSYGFTPEYGLKTSVLQVKSDTLYEKSLKDLEKVVVYVKSKLPETVPSYKAEW